MQVFRAYSFDADDNSFYVPMSQSDRARRLRRYMTWSLWMFRRLLTPLGFTARDWRVATSYQNTATSDETSVEQQQVDDQVREISVAVGFVERTTAFPLLTSVAFTVHCSLSAVTHAPFHPSMPRPASQAGPMHEAKGVGKLVNAALLSLINKACVNVCCTTLLSSELVGPACVQARSSNPRGRG